MRSLILFAVASLALTVVAAGNEKVVCYFSSWAVYRPGAGQVAIEDIDASLCTHAIYAFVGIDGDNVRVMDKWQDLAENGGKDAFRRFNALRKQNPKLKTMVAIGGWNEGSVKYSAMASDSGARSRFVKNVVAFVKKHNFDGFDVDWEYPAQRGGAATDVQNYVELLRELRQAFDKEGLLLSAAVGVSESSASLSYNIPEMSKHLHFINLMTYDFHTAGESTIDFNAPLYPAIGDKNPQLNVKAAVKYWIGQGADPKKLILGIASYGRAFTLANPNNAKVGDAASGVGAAGPYTREGGMLGYNEICEFITTQGWTAEFDEERHVPFAHKGDQWVGYDDVRSVKDKAEFVKKMGLGGAMMWSIETDDFKGNCGDKFPLLKTINQVLHNGKPVSQRPPQPHKPTQKPATIAPRIPQQPGNVGSGNGKCTKAGDMADPTTCKQFIKCVDQGDGTFKPATMLCPPGLCFKASIGICDWA